LANGMLNPLMLNIYKNQLDIRQGKNAPCTASLAGMW
jgi:hypothetical protein